MHLILYSKVGCHLCEGLQEKLKQIADLDIQLEIREITTNPDWFDLNTRSLYYVYKLMGAKNSSLVSRPAPVCPMCSKFYSNTRWKMGKT